jgi:hypothetical protein
MCVFGLLKFILETLQKNYTEIKVNLKNWSADQQQAVECSVNDLNTVYMVLKTASVV